MSGIGKSCRQELPRGCFWLTAAAWRIPAIRLLINKISEMMPEQQG